MQDYPYALQLYSVRDHCERNPEAGLRRVKESGYDYVELAGLYGLDASDYKALLDAVGLTPISKHVGYEIIAADIEEVQRQARILGVSYVVVPWLGVETCPDREHWLLAAQQMNSAGAKLRESGIHLCYHNHAHEFARIDGNLIFDLIFENSDAENLSIELDTCWAHAGGMDVPALLARHVGRVPLAHIKDCKPLTGPESVVFTELGRGVMDWDTVLPAAKAAGAQWFIVEQDESEGDSMESAAVNAAFMKTRNASAL